ncbi:MAG TPA: gephyrin-like molybdotransferase Glp [Gemmatimonadaceae bacterium]
MSLSVSEASARILAGIGALPSERVSLERALGRVLAVDVRSTIAHPPWDNSSMDGYAVRATDVAGANADRPIVLPVLETVAAGGRASSALRPGTAIRIMTGAPLPDGADTVIRVEDTDGGAERVAIRDPRDAGRNVRPRGEDLQPGATAVSAGTLLGPAHLGVLASVGAAMVDVHKRPRVGVLTTGDELVDVGEFDQVERGERIVSSNSYTLGAGVRTAGGDVVDLGIARDDRAELESRLRAASGCDLLITSGGVSVGEFDYTKAVLQSLGGTLDLWRVRMRPGAPLGFGRLGGMPWLGLPGNPVSSMVTFELFARPVIRRLRGERRVFRRPIVVRTDEALTLAAPLMHFMRVIVEERNGELHARLTGPQGSGLLTSMARANALLIVPPERTTVGSGEVLHALPLDNESWNSERLEL